jgi:nucleoside-diphosphate-sugar epimerase
MRVAILTHNYGMKRLLIIGCGDIALRTLPLLQGHYRIYALVRNFAKADGLRIFGVTPILGDLDDSHSLARIAGLADVVLHFAPPDRQGHIDTRTSNLLAALSTRLLPKRLIYISTSGVYGDCGGDFVSETRPVNPQSDRARLRVSAEQQIRSWATRNHVNANILRVPGIIAEDRLPVDRIKAGSPAIIASEDGYSNHIHADDLALNVIAALRYAKPNRVYHTVDDDEMKMGDYFDVVADAFQLARPPRLSRAEVQRTVSPMMWSFMNESRRLTNVRMKQELKVKLMHPSVKSQKN